MVEALEKIVNGQHPDFDENEKEIAKLLLDLVK